MTNELEKKVIALVAADRLDIPISSMSGKLKRMKPKLAKEINLDEYEGDFHGERTYARLEVHEAQKARGMASAVKEFAEQYPTYGAILQGMIAEQRVTREPTLYFGTQPGCRLTTGDYIDVMTSLGFSEAKAEGMYQELMDTSRKISRVRKEERSILVG